VYHNNRDSQFIIRLGMRAVHERLFWIYIYYQGMAWMLGFSRGNEPVRATPSHLEQGCLSGQLGPCDQSNQRCPGSAPQSFFHASGKHGIRIVIGGLKVRVLTRQ
jgi:hypothetical protein